jgi:hypothetical protein
LRERVMSRYSWDESVEATEELYNHLLGRDRTVNAPLAPSKSVSNGPQSPKRPDQPAVIELDQPAVIELDQPAV